MVPEVAARYAANSPLAMLGQYGSNLKKYKAVTVDVGVETGDLPKELRTLKHVDLTDAKFKSGSETLTKALSRRDDFAIESYPIPRGAASRYLAEFVANKAGRFFAFPVDRCTTSWLCTASSCPTRSATSLNSAITST